MLRPPRPHPAPSQRRRQRAPCAAPARGPAFRLGCGRPGAAGSPALPLGGVLCPLVRCLLLSLARGWQPLLRLVACGAEVARAVGSGACQSPSAAPLVPRLTFNRPLPGGSRSGSQIVGWVREGRSPRYLAKDPPGERGKSLSYRPSPRLRLNLTQGCWLGLSAAPTCSLIPYLCPRESAPS